MEVSLRWLTVWSLVVYTSSALIHSTSAQAYDEYAHEWITRSAFDYLKNNRHIYPETTNWVEGLGPEETFLESMMVRAVVDTDYRSDTWLNAIFHPAINGAQSTDGVVAMFTTLFHFVTIKVPGRYWEYDGYSYRGNTHKGNDSYLAEPTLRISGKQSAPFGGRSPAGHPLRGADLGTYDVGFKGTLKDWNRMFEGNTHFASEAVFPPSYIPARTAFQKMLWSPRVRASSVDSWTEDQRLVTTWIHNTRWERSFWRGEVAGMPRYMDALGIAMHLIQDATVPHHVEDTSDRCHPEYERMVDQLTCGASGNLDYTTYYNGSFANDHGPHCNVLYDPEIVTKILFEEKLLEPISIEQRIMQAATLSSRWDWRVKSKLKYATTLPDGTFFEGKTCQALLAFPTIQEQAKYQFNLAIAETVAIFELSAHLYETRHFGEKAPEPVYNPFSAFFSSP